MMKTRAIVLFIAIASVFVIGTLMAQLNGCQPGSGINSFAVNYAPWYCKNINPAITSVWANWLPVMLLAISVSIAIATIIFMFGVALRNERLRTFGIGELYEAMATTIMVGFFLFIAAVMFGLLPAMTAGPVDPYDAALSYIATTINTTSATSSSLFNIAAIAKYYSTFLLSVQSGPSGDAGAPIGEALSFSLQEYFFFPAWALIVFMFEAMISLYAQFYMIMLFMYSAVPVFLIPGIIFRAFIPTRHLGGMMIAISIGFYFIMPTLFAVAYYFTSNNISTQLAIASGTIHRYGYGSGQTLITSGATPSSPLAQSLDQNINQTFSSYWLSILFFPAVILAMTYSLITQIAELLGGLAKTSSRLRQLV